MKPRIIFLILLLIAAFFRLYRIADFTQFRGDQGSAGIIIYEAWKHKTLPLVGPTVSTGQLPGPAYYYIIALPLIVSGFNPLVPAIMFAIMGVATVTLLFYLGRKLYGVPAATIVAGLYALSPVIIRMDQTMWNPTAVPFLVTVMLCCFYKVLEEKRHKFFPLASFCLGILVQFHYTNILWIIPFAFILYRIRSFRWTFFTILAFFLPLAPFFYYESTHQFADLKEVLTIFFLPHPLGEPGPRFIGRFQNVLSRSFFTVFPLFTALELRITAIIIFGAPFFKRKQRWSIGLASFALGSILLLSWYKGPFFDHYLWFSVPISFLLIGSFVQEFVPPKKSTIVVAISILAVLVFYVPKLEFFKPRIGRLEKTRATVDAIIADSKGEPFSFGLIASNSYSDSHYRFFFRLRGHDPLPVLNTTYKTLYLVCGTDPCPPFPHLSMKAVREIRVYCYDLACKGEYPKVDLMQFDNFPYEPKTVKITGVTIYIYHRKQT